MSGKGVYGRGVSARIALALTFVVALGLGLAAGAARAEEGWEKYESKKFGFSMLVPDDTVMKEKEYEDGWGELYAESDGVKLYALAKLGDEEEPEEIEKVGLKLTGIPESAWKEIDKGENQHGWKWYRTVRAEKGGKLVFGGYGVGPKGSYLLLLQTTSEDYAENKADYLKWYESIRLK